MNQLLCLSSELSNRAKQLDHANHVAIKAVQGLLDEQHVQADDLEVASGLFHKLALPRRHPKARLHLARGVVRLCIADLARCQGKGVIDCLFGVLCLCRYAYTYMCIYGSFYFVFLPNFVPVCQSTWSPMWHEEPIWTIIWSSIWRSIWSSIWSSIWNSI